MAVSVTGNLHLVAALDDVRSAVTGSSRESGRRSMAFDVAWQIASGTAASQADRIWADTRTVADGATDALDLSGTLTDAFGATVSFATLKAIVIAAASANTTTLTLARPAGATGVTLFAATSDALAPISAGGLVCWVNPAAGLTVTNSTADIINVVNSASAAANYDVILIGTSA